MGCRARACSTRSERQWQRRCPAGCPRTIFGKERPLLSVIQRPLFAPWRMKRCVAHGEAPILKRGHAGAVRRASVRAACLANGRSILQAALVQRAFTPRSIFRGKSLPRAVEYLAVIADLFDHINCPGVFEAKVLPTRTLHAEQTPNIRICDEFSSTTFLEVTPSSSASSKTLESISPRSAIDRRPAAPRGRAAPSRSVPAEQRIRPVSQSA